MDELAKSVAKQVTGLAARGLWMQLSKVSQNGEKGYMGLGKIGRSEKS